MVFKPGQAIRVNGRRGTFLRYEHPNCSELFYRNEDGRLCITASKLATAIDDDKAMAVVGDEAGEEFSDEVIDDEATEE